VQPDRGSRGRDPEGEAELRALEARERVHQEGLALAWRKAPDGAHDGAAEGGRVDSLDRVVEGRVGRARASIRSGSLARWRRSARRRERSRFVAMPISQGSADA
jgi:hypothetical protein